MHVTANSPASFDCKEVNASPTLNTDDLTSYLNDHLAGSVGALELIEHLAKNYPETALEGFFADLHTEVTADQQVLRDLMRTVEVKESAVRKAGAWMMEKLGRTKLGLEKNEVRGTGLLEALEGVVLGISGKALLWRSLAAATTRFPELNGFDYAALERRAVEQRDRVERQRLAAAREAFVKN